MNDARLIASAPDLLVAAKRAIGLIDDLPQTALDAARMGSGYLGDVKDALRAAIACAEEK